MPRFAPLLRPAQARAFTLIELLTVIAIIGILAAIIIPTVGKVRQTARNAQCVSVLRDWGRAFQLYANDNKGQYTFKDWASAATDGPYRPYLGNSSAFSSRFRACPMLSQERINSGTLTYGIVRPSPVIANNDKISLVRACNPSQFLMLSDAISNSNTTMTNSEDSINALVGPLFNSALAAPGAEDVASRHGGSAINGLFGDGSVKKINGSPAASNDRNSIYAMRTTWFQLY